MHGSDVRSPPCTAQQWLEQSGGREVKCLFNVFVPQITTVRVLGFIFPKAKLAFIWVFVAELLCKLLEVNKQDYFV